MDLIDHLRLMARYNLWAYQRLYALVDGLDEADYRREDGLFFRSIHGTLNHLLVVEQVWRTRLDGVTSNIRSLDQELHADRTGLRTALLDYTADWIPRCEALSETDLAGDLVYRSLKGDPFRLPRAVVPLHVFNHATHHRGQISAALTRLGAEAPVMDLPYYLLELAPEQWRRG